MKKIILTLSSITLLVACNGGGGSSSNGGGTTPPATDIYTGTYIVAPSGTTLQAFGTNGNTVYTATPTGLYSVTPATTQAQALKALNTASSTITPVNTQTGVVQITGFNGALYYATGSTIYTTGQQSQIPSGQGTLTALSPPSSNGTLIYGTNLGYVGLINNPAGKQISQIPDNTGGVLAIGCIANGSCNSGQQGFMALTANNAGQMLPNFESSSASTLNYPTSFYYYNNKGGWIQQNYYLPNPSPVSVNYYTSLNNPGVQSNATPLGSVAISEYITAVTFNNGNIYVGTNLFNIYAAPGYTCNNGQVSKGCPVNLTGPLNVNSSGAPEPLGWLQTPANGTPAASGSTGIVNLSVNSNGSLVAIAQESSTYAVSYVSNATTY